MSNEYEMIYNQMQEQTGSIDPIRVNESEKNEYKSLYDKMQAQVLENKIKHNSYISYSDMPWGKTILNSLKSLDDSFFTYWQNLGEMISHPILTGKNFKNLITGITKTGVLKAAYGDIENLPFELNEEQDQDTLMALNFEKEMYARYGTEAGFKKALATDPFGVIMDVQSVLLPALKLTKTAGKVTKSAGLINIISKAEKAISIAEPIQLTKSTIRGIEHGIMNIPKLKKFPSNLYARAIKLADNIPMDRRQRLIQIAMDNKSGVVFKETEKLQNQISELEKIKDDVISKTGNQSFMMYNQAFKGLDELQEQLLKVSAQPVKREIDTIKKVLLKNKQDYEALTGKSRDFLDPKDVNDLKKRFNLELSDAYQKAYEKIKMTPIKKEAAMTINKNFREFLETLIPEIPISKDFKLTNDIIKKSFGSKTKSLSLKDLNRLQGDLIEIRKAIINETYKTTTGSLMDFQVGQKTATTAFVGMAGARAVTDDISVISTVGSVTGGAGFILGLIDSSPRLKSKIANYLNDLQSVGLNPKPTGVLIRLGIYQANNMYKAYNASEEENSF